MSTTLLLADASTTGATTSGSQGTNAVILLFFILCGVAGFQRARQIRTETGRPPWGMMPWAWLLLCLVLPLIGLICVIVASRSARRLGPAADGGAAGDLPAPYVPVDQIPVDQTPLTVEQAWAPPRADQPPVSAFPPAAPAVRAGARTAVDVLPAARPKRRFSPR